MSTQSQYKTFLEPDMLQLNMETISKELNDLIEMEKASVCGVSQNACKKYLKQLNEMNSSPQVIMNRFQHQPRQFQQRQLLSTSAATTYYPNQTTNLNCGIHPSYFQASTMCNSMAASHLPNTSMQPYFYPYLAVNYPQPIDPVYGNNTNMFPPSSTNNVGLAPEYEIHYLNANPVSSGRQSAVPLISANTKENRNRWGFNNGFRKYQKQSHQSSTSIESIDYDKINVDIRELGWSLNGKEANPVLRIFALLRDMHRAISEDLLAPQPVFLDDICTTNALTPKVQMASTMNVQYQVKQASRKVTMFLCNMQRILNNNKVYDQGLYAECEQYLSQLQKLIAQFDLYKGMELEHKRGQFISEDLQAKAGNLEILMEQMNKQIREVNARINVLNWFINIKCRGMQSPSMKHQHLSNDQQQKNNSEIGVINEILQLCNKTMEKMSNDTSPNADGNATSGAAAVEKVGAVKALEPATTVDGISENNQNSNIDIPGFAAAAIPQIGSKINYCPGNGMVSSAGRHPVFYIG